MKILEELKGLEGHDVFAFWDKDGDGGCPCFSGKVSDDKGTVEVWGRCWRVSDTINEGFQELHVSGNHPDLKAIAERTKKLLDETKWYNPYRIIYDDPQEPTV